MRANIRRLLDDLGSLLLVVATCAVMWRLFASPRSAQTSAPVEAVQGLSLSAGELRHAFGTGEVVVVEFSDFECPFCARHATTTGVNLVDELAKSGQIQMVFMNFPLPMHPNARKAGEAAECAAKQGRYWEMRQQLFQEAAGLDQASLVRHAAAVGLGRASFLACLEGRDAAASVQADVDIGRRLGVSSTPSFLLGRRNANGEVRLLKRIRGAVPLEVFRAAIADLSALNAEGRKQVTGVRPDIGASWRSLLIQPPDIRQPDLRNPGGI